MKSFALIVIICVSCAVVHAQTPHKAVQAVKFAVNSSHYSSFVGSKSLTVPFSNGTSSTKTNSASMIFSGDAKAAKKITVALNSSLPEGIALQVSATQHNIGTSIQKVISTAPSEIVAGYFYDAGASFRKINLQYSAMRTSAAVVSTDQTVLYTITD